MENHSLSYTYLIGWSKIIKPMYYYGVRFGNKVHPNEDFWHYYFTSSRMVPFYRHKYGEPDIRQIRKIFDSAKKAQLWEGKVFCRIRIKSNGEKWLNTQVAPKYFKSLLAINPLSNKPALGIPVTINEVNYNSKAEASREIGLSWYKIMQLEESNNLDLMENRISKIDKDEILNILLSRAYK